MRTKTESRPRRIKSVYEHWITSRQQEFASQETTMEILPPDKIRLFSVFNGVDFETIYIGKTEYKKEKGVWTINEFGWQRIKDMIVQLPPKNPGKVICFLTENVTTDGQFTNLIEWKYVDEFRVQNSDTNLLEDHKVTLEHKFWINRENLLIRSERTDSNSRPETNNLRFLRYYSYDDNLKIEAPVK